MAITIKDIAKVAGVNYSTVSRALNNSPLVADKTKKYVNKIAKELGFEFNANARFMITSKTSTIGVIYPEDFDEFGTHIYYSSLQNYLRKSLEVMDLDLIISFPKNRRNDKNNIKRLIGSHKVDGLIIAQPTIESETLQYIRESNIPFVFFHQPTLLSGVDEITVDHCKGGYLATKHLLEKGHKRILCLASSNHLEIQQRIMGYENALNEYNILDCNRKVVILTQEFQAGYYAVKQIFNNNKPYDAIFATTDLLAWGAMIALQENGYNVPKDVAIVGYDDVEMATYLRPALTTIHQPQEEIVLLTCERLSQKMKNDPAASITQKILLEPTLIVRSST